MTKEFRSAKDQTPRYVEIPTLKVSIPSPHPRDGLTDPQAYQLFRASTYTDQCECTAGVVYLNGRSTASLIGHQEFAKCLICNAHFYIKITLDMLPVG